VWRAQAGARGDQGRAGDAKILEHLGLPSQALPLGRAAEEPQGGAVADRPPSRDEMTQHPAPDEFDQRWGTVDFAE
jgi:hypothetical protein